MSRRESLIVALSLGVMCPFLTFIAGWWISAALFFEGIAHIAEHGIAIVAFTGLAAGLIIDALWLKRLVAAFYTADLVLLGAVYAVCSAIALASCMGLPLGNLLLGTLGGVYVGRRAFHSGASAAVFGRASRRAGWFTAAFTGAGAFAIGILALREQSVVEVLADLLGTARSAIAGSTGLAVIVTLVVVLIVLQFWCTSTAARVAFGRSGSPDFQTH